ncbi:MAG TPA: hypothetical protein DDZ51_02905 [Planctomycetaceae bacterium]|nr:hypothetical protein [Planctomycetaceae bacterium]
MINGSSLMQINRMLYVRGFQNAISKPMLELAQAKACFDVVLQAGWQWRLLGRPRHLRSCKMPLSRQMEVHGGITHWNVTLCLAFGNGCTVLTRIIFPVYVLSAGRFRCLRWGGYSGETSGW